MQFGKISGLGLIVLGILLCGLQFIQWTLPAKPAAPSDRSMAQPEHKTTSLPGIIGTGSLVGGIVLLATARRKDEPEPKHAVK
jgi:hypothetical protein